MLKEEKENGKISSGTEFSEQRILNLTESQVPNQGPGALRR